MDRCQRLLATWSQALAELQVTTSGNPRLDGALLCPACGRIHGRCADAMHPFLVMARMTGDDRWVERAKLLFEWTEATVSQNNGAVLNDIDSSWDGITVFYAAQLADCLRYHADLLDAATRLRWEDRLASAAAYLVDYEALNENNVNYTIACAYALERAGSLLGIEAYRLRATDLMGRALECLDAAGMLFGEGVPRHKRSARGRRPVDIGYNVEESLPIMALYARERGDTLLMERVRHAYEWHLAFLLPDGGWDNSFGTRKFKWTYWGSRTTDGCCAGLAAAAEGARGELRDSLLDAARANLALLESCTVEGLLAGGPHYGDARQAPCVHHSFDHARMLAELVDLGMSPLLEEKGGAIDERGRGGTGAQDNFSCHVDEYPDLGVCVARVGDMRMTVSFADWEYRRNICTSGGMISLLHHRELGPVLVAGMAEYARIELANMQVPHLVRHESIAPRIDLACDGGAFSSVYDTAALLRYEEDDAGVRVRATGTLRNVDHEALDGGAYEISYDVRPASVGMSARLGAGSLVLPVVSRSCEEVELREGGIVIRRPGGAREGRGAIVLEVLRGRLLLPYETKRVFNLVPGLQALRVDVAPDDGDVEVRISFEC